MVIAHLAAQRFGAPQPPLRLRGLDPSARYEDRADGTVWRGAVLAHHGLTIGLRGDLDTAVFHFRKI